MNEQMLSERKNSFNPLKHPACLDFPLWYEATAWSEHMPFAMYIISALRPNSFVELGTYHGSSYFAFCQAVDSLKTNTQCHAIDTWQGDEHAGEIDEMVLPRLRNHNDGHYADFSQLVQSTFDDALVHFPDGSIDLLHIDGFHTYEAVKHDFETWLPKLSVNGIVLFHDVNVRERGFGVWKLWEELCAKHRSFTFLHGHGLGVLAVGDETPAGLEDLFAANESETVLIRKFFHEIGARIEAMDQHFSNKEHKSYLQTHKAVVKISRLMRAYRVLKDEGVGSLFRKVKRKIGGSVR